MRYRKLYIRSFSIHKVYNKEIIPTMFLDEFVVLLGIVPFTFIYSVALNHSSINMLNHWSPEFRFKVILVSSFSGMNLYSNLPVSSFPSVWNIFTTCSGVIVFVKYTFDTEPIDSPFFCQLKHHPRGTTSLPALFLKPLSGS